MDEQKKLIILDYFKRYKNFGRTDEEISSYLLSNKFVTQSELEEILPPKVVEKKNSVFLSNFKEKINSNYKLIGIIIGIILILGVLAFSVFYFLGSFDSDKTNLDRSLDDSSTRNSNSKVDNAEINNLISNIKTTGDTNKTNSKLNDSNKDLKNSSISNTSSLINNTNNLTNISSINITIQNQTINLTNTTILNNSTINITNTTISNSTNIINNSNSSIINLDDIVLELENVSLINQTLTLSWDISNYTVEFEDDVRIIYRSVEDNHFNCEDYRDYTDLDDVDDENNGEVVDDSNLIVGDNYYNLCLYVDVYDEYVTGETLIVHLNQTPINTTILTPTFENLFDCGGNFTCYISKIQNNLSVKMTIQTSLNNIYTNFTINYSTMYKYEPLNLGHFAFNTYNYLPDPVLTSAEVTFIKSQNDSYIDMSYAQIESILTNYFNSKNRLNISRICVDNSTLDYQNYLTQIRLNSLNLSASIDSFANCTIS